MDNLDGLWIVIAIYAFLLSVGVLWTAGIICWTMGVLIIDGFLIFTWPIMLIAVLWVIGMLLAYYFA